MAWETRGGNAYYYRSVRSGGRVVKEYVGCSPVANAIAELEALDRQKADLIRGERRADQVQWNAIDRAVADALQEVRSVIDAVLTAAGYHRHDRGEWRKKRMASKVELSDIKQEQAVRKAIVPETRVERMAITRAALGGDRKQEDAAIACIRKHPGEMNIGILQTTNAILDMIAGESRVLHEVLMQEAKQERDQLAGNDPTPLESLLIERVVACALLVSHAERRYASAMRSNNSMSLAQCDSLQKRIDRSHNRYLSAIKTLAQVRKLQLPAVQIALPGSTQVNIGERQINMAGSGSDQTNLS